MIFYPENGERVDKMRKYLFWIVLITLFILVASSVYAQDLSGVEIIRKVNEILNQESGFTRTRMVIQTSSGQFRTFEFESWAKDRGEKNLIRYIEPSRARGQAILMLNNADDIWMYFPRTKRVRKLATHAKRQKMQGSDFSYEDMGSGDTFITDFDAFRLADQVKGEEACYRVRLDRLPSSDSSYLKVVMWIRKSDFFPLVIEYFEDDYPDIPSKILLMEDIRIIQEIPTATKMTMKNELDFTETLMELIKVDYGLELSDEMFTERALRK